jgi:hypothetical protein
MVCPRIGSTDLNDLRGLATFGKADEIWTCGRQDNFLIASVADATRPQEVIGGAHAAARLGLKGSTSRYRMEKLSLPRQPS